MAKMVTTFALFVCLSSWLVQAVHGSTVACVQTSDCETILRQGSQCVDGFCTNPFYHGGCLKSLLPDDVRDNLKKRLRVCNSQDPPEAEQLGYCRPSPMKYSEIRIGGRNWESAMFGAWIMQILLSEILDVPTSIEGGVPGLDLNFYHPNNAFEFWKAEFDPALTELTSATRVKDCSTVTSDPDHYEPCSHILPEVWWATYDESAFEGLEKIGDLGVMAEGAMFIPLFAVEDDATLTSFVGLRGEANRRKLAETFKRPTRWKQYCDEFSPTACQEPDSVAQRAPLDETEENVFFQEGAFTGFFRATPDHDCDKFPHNCTGDLIQSPCEWYSVAKQQCHHLGIALESHGPQANGHYGYEEQAQITMAANATKSPIMIILFDSDPIYESYMKTDTQFTRVTFPPPTQECVDARKGQYYYCAEDASPELLFGTPEGACDTFPEALQKVASLAFSDITMAMDLENEFRSPAFDAFAKYRISLLNVYEFFALWRERGTDYWHFDPRDATCQWVVNNLDLVMNFVPESYPRLLDEEAVDTPDALSNGALGVSIVAIASVLVSMVFTFIRRNTAVFYYAQMSFLYLLLSGMLLVAVGAAFLAAPLSDWSCTLTSWMMNLGFALQLVPLLIRVMAINQLAADGKQMQRVRLRPAHLLLYVGAASCIVIGYLLAWTIDDAPVQRLEYYITNRTTEEGETVVEAHDYCGSENDYWYLVTFAWMALILVPSCMIAILVSRVKENMNDTPSMSLALYSHALILVVLVAVSVTMYESNRSELMSNVSIILSVDTLLSLGLYVLPKFFKSGEKLEAEPLPDVFAHTTISQVFVDGFTAWSSVREPVQVFLFLEKLYGRIDTIADRYGVYKVETLGECYVAATGLPSPQNDHPLRMAKFASECMRTMPTFLKSMEVEFGPDTGDLSLRIGIHSGTVTGGFLKGKGARFQLFGDATTTAALVQSTGMSNHIHISEATANLLIQAGKRRWLVEREDKVHTDETGEMTTYWLVKGNPHELGGHEGSSTNPSHFLDCDTEDEELASLQSEHRWIEWNVEVFKGLLKPIIARRGNGGGDGSRHGPLATQIVKGAEMPLEEVVEIVKLPKFDKRAARRQRENESDELEVPAKVVEQLKQFITEIAGKYNDNPFHNFAHASYVVMAVSKFLHRIVAATEADLGDGDDDRYRSHVQAALHSHTYGITSDPLTQFACVFSALIHDVDHPGVPNPQLIKEDKKAADRYKNRSVAEQKSFDISWGLLMEARFSDLLSTICHNTEELRRFRQLVINSIMATDLGDKQLKDLRNARWEKAFELSEASSTYTESVTPSNPDEESARESAQDHVNRKATIVIEHLIQAADVAHMSQHWNIYRKWNECLFRETYRAWKEGRAESNPAESWFQGELGFLDFYIIPLSKKLRDCGVFGPTSAENLNNAINNRKMWEKNGRKIIKEMLQRVESEYKVEAPLEGTVDSCYTADAEC